MHISGPRGSSQPSSPPQFPAPPQGLGTTPTWRCQQRPRCSLSGFPRSLPGTRGPRAAGARPPTRQELDQSEGGRWSSPAPISVSPPQASAPPGLVSLPSPPLSTQSADIVLPQRHRHTQAHAYSHSLASYSTSAEPPPTNSTWALSPEHILERGGLALTGVYSHSPQTLPLRPTLVQPTPVHACPATHGPRGQTAAAASRRCRRGRPRSGAPCCGWPSCAPAWASSTGSPGARGGCPHGSLTPAAPSREGPAGAPRLRPARP